jgi:predicted SAM-dependent methyltransferase
MAVTWAEVAARTPLYLNMGGKGHCDPHAPYERFVSVDLAPGRGWRVTHDLRQPLPLDDASVDGIHTEDCFAYFTPNELTALFAECHRVLKPGGRLRVAVPDFEHPRHKTRVKNGKDTAHPEHHNLPTKHNMEALLQASPFTDWTFYHYWKDGTFIQEPIDYTLGWVKRTPDNDPRNHSIRPKGYAKNLLFLLSRGFFTSESERAAWLEGQPYFITSLVFDCIKSKKA